MCFFMGIFFVNFMNCKDRIDLKVREFYFLIFVVVFLYFCNFI